MIFLIFVLAMLIGLPIHLYLEAQKAKQRKLHPRRSWSSRQDDLAMDRERRAEEAYQNDIAILDSFFDGHKRR